MTEFEIDDSYVEKYEKHCVGNEIHQEIWVPAEKLEEFNKNIFGKIQIKEAYYGDNYSGIYPSGVSGFKEKDVNKQIYILESVLNYNYMDFSGTLFVEWKVVNLNFLFWYNSPNEHNKTLELIYNCLLKNNKLYICKVMEF